MSRFALGAVLAAALATVLATGAVSCSKSAGTKESPKASPGGGTGEVIAVPGGEAGKGERVAVPGDPAAARGPAAGAPGGAAGAQAPIDPAMRLKPDEGSISIEVPPDAKPGAETTAKVIVTPGPNFKINFEFPTKLSLQTPTGVTLAKAELKAGGPDKVQGDAEKFEEKQLAFAVKLTPTAAGTHTINGNFKFAVCDKDQCLPKREAIAIQVAAN